MTTPEAPAPRPAAAAAAAAAGAGAPSLPAGIQAALDNADHQLLARQYYDALASYGELLSTVSLSLLPSGTSAGDPVLTKLAGFTLYVRLGDCNSAIGRWETAQVNYRSAAAYHGPLDTGTDVTPLWSRYARLYVSWADSLYLAGDPDHAAPLYASVVTAGGTAPAAGDLYSAPALAAAVPLVTAALSSLTALIATPTATPAGIDPAIAAPIVDAYVKLGQIAAGLHLYGYSPQSVPVWTFDYLQQVAAQYCQYAVSTEQSVINFWDRADQSQLTMLQVQQHVADSLAAVGAAAQQQQAAQAQVGVYQAGLTLAGTRATSAATDAGAYSALQSQAILYSAMATQVSGGTDDDPDQISALAYQLASNPGLVGTPGELAAANQLVSSRLSQQYEVGALGRTAAEMQGAVTQAQAELAAATAQATAAAGQVALAALQASDAQAQAEVLSAATFTASGWKAAGDQLYALYRRYLAAAIRAARLMQQAYNFENDAAVSVIRDDYSMDETRGLLAADLLMADVSSFTDLLLTSRNFKTQPITHTVSLAGRQSYRFETQFRKTGVIEFDTTAEDFDLAYPGTYAGRIRYVEVAVQGLVPPAGISGTLTNGGVSFYRTPSDSWTDSGDGQLRRRIQPSETLVLSSYARASDPLAAAPGSRQPGIFAGAGVIGSWRLEIPPEVNDLDYDLITDVLITITYDACFDYQLAGQVRQLLASQPGAHTTQVGWPLRWLYPDLYFELISKQSVSLSIAPSDLPLNQAQATLTQVAVLVTTQPGDSPAGLTVTVSAPGSATPASSTTGADGLVTSSANSPLTSQLGRPVVGDWTLGLSAPSPDSPAAGLSAVANVTLLLEYSYTPRSLS
jgi:Tc toxin complex TcA C-terminal TcB-binding domain